MKRVVGHSFGRRLLLVILSALIFTPQFIQFALAQSKMDSGFHYPTDSVLIDKGNWLATACDGYTKGKYHIGQDIGGRIGDPVYAVADGFVEETKNGNDVVNSKWIWIKHCLSDGTYFYALYAHVNRSNSRSWNKGDPVRAGEPIATIADYPDNLSSDHLHFGIRPEGILTSGWGHRQLPQKWDCRNQDKSKLDPRGFVAPYDFLSSHSPCGSGNQCRGRIHIAASNYANPTVEIRKLDGTVVLGWRGFSSPFDHEVDCGEYDVEYGFNPNSDGKQYNRPLLKRVRVGNGETAGASINYNDYRKPPPPPPPPPPRRRPDLVAIAKSGTGSRRTEVHVLSGNSDFQRFIVQTATALGEAGDNWDFKMADWDRDGQPDLFGVLKSNTGSRKTEVHVLSAASNFQQFIAQNATALGEAGSNWEFEVADWDRDGRPDLVGILKSNTGSRKTELHVLSAASNFQQFIAQNATGLGESGSNWDFEIADWDQDGRPDLVGILKYNTGSRRTEIHVLSAASNFQQFIAQNATGLGESGDNWDFEMADWDRDGRPDLVGILKYNTGSGKTEVHILSAASNFQQFIVQTATGLHQTGNNFAFAMTTQVAGRRQPIIPNDLQPKVKLNLSRAQTGDPTHDKARARSKRGSGSSQLKTTASNRNLPLTQRKGAVATAARQSISSQSQSRQSHLTTIQSMVSLSTFVLPHYSAELDFDQDGLTDEEELEMLSNPAEADTDGDGLTDGEEFYLSLTDLLSADTDGDGWEDGEEIFLTETNPSIKDDSLATHPKQSSGKRSSH
jgi:hypothetical protein